MNYDEALAYITAVSSLGSRPGLDRISSLARLLGNPQSGMKFVHVAGTNGKGSFCAMTASILREAGLKTGLYVSPCITRFNDRMSIDGEPISDSELAEITTRVRECADLIPEPVTEFEIITVVAFEYFRRHGCDVVVLEVGMGGRLDATNIIDSPVLSVITGIALDHMAYLGDTVEKIAAEKAGIIRAGCPVHWGGKDAGAGSVIKARAEELGADFHAVDYSQLDNIRCTLDGSDFDFGEYRDLHINLLGLYQPENAASVVSAIPLLRCEGFNIPDDAVRRGLEKTVWPARFERISKSPVIIYDGSHNPQGMEAAVRSIHTLFNGERINILTGVLRDKDYHTMAKMLSTVTNRAFTITPANTRALPAAEYAEVFRALGIEADSYASLKSGVDAAFAETKNTGIPLVFLGTLYMYSDVRAALGI